MAKKPLSFSAAESAIRPDKPWHRDAFIDASHRIARLGYCEWDYVNGRVISCTPYYAEIFGMTIQEVIESQSNWESVLQQLHPDDREHYIRSYEAQLGAGTHEIEYRAFRKNGEIRHIKEVGILFFDQNGTPTESMGLLQDVTEQKERIQDLENRDAMARQVELVTDIGHFIWNIGNETFRYCSPGFLKIIGADKENYLSELNSLEAYVNKVHEDDRGRVFEEYRQQLERGSDLTCDYRLHHPDGSCRWIRESSVIAMDSTIGATQVIGIIQDITEQKLSEQSLRDAKVLLETEVAQRTRKLSETVDRLNREMEEREAVSGELEAKNAELERFTYTVSHDLKSPLVTLKGFLGLLEKDIAANDVERVGVDIEQLKSAADTMAVLLDDLLELSRIGRVIGALSTCDLADIVASATEILRSDLDRHGVEVVIEDMPQVRVDQSRIVEVFTNLLENAIKFRGDQESPHIHISATPRDGMICCSVRDNGIGIAREYHAQVFELFERLDPRIDGTGVGLALVKRIVETHGGHVWIDSGGPNMGCTLSFTLPCA